MISNSSDKIHQTWCTDFTQSLYVFSAKSGNSLISPPPFTADFLHERPRTYNGHARLINYWGESRLNTWPWVQVKRVLTRWRCRSRARWRTISFDIVSDHIQGSAKRRAPGLVNVIPAVAYHFCLALPAAFTQPGDHLLVEPCSVRPLPVDKKLRRQQIDPTFQGLYLWQFLTGISSTWLSAWGFLKFLSASKTNRRWPRGRTDSNLLRETRERDFANNLALGNWVYYTGPNLSHQLFCNPLI